MSSKHTSFNHEISEIKTLCRGSFITFNLGFLGRHHSLTIAYNTVVLCSSVPNEVFGRDMKIENSPYL